MVVFASDLTFPPRRACSTGLAFFYLVLAPYFKQKGRECGHRDLAPTLEHLRSLFIELGKGFAFVGSQYHIEVGGQDFYIDLLFYHLNLRCFIVVDLKIEEFKPEFAGKMNFYLSAVDDQLRHESDAQSIGMILCKGRNEMIVEYALRESARPMGVAEYRLSTTLPKGLEADLPSQEVFASQFPVMSLVKLRIDIERAIRSLMELFGIETRPLGIGSALRELKRRDLAPDLTDSFLDVLQAMNHAAHGFDITPQDADEALKRGNSFLKELRVLGAEG